MAGANPYTTTLGLDSVGDRLTETTTHPAGSGQADRVRTYSYNGRHQLTLLHQDSGGQAGDVHYQWDNEGRLLSKGAPLAPAPKTFTWDSRDRLKSVEEAFSTVAQYRYEETGLKTESFWPSFAQGSGGQAPMTRRYQWVGREMLAVWKPGANPGDPYTVASRIVRGVDREILGHESNGNSFIHVHSDRLGSVSAETDLSGTITHSRVYDPFGNVRTETGTSELPLGYTGQEMDPVTGLVQMKARWYDPDAGIFISEDPRSYSPLDPFSLQEYLYAAGNPVRYIDPSGMLFEGVGDRILRGAEKLSQAVDNAAQAAREFNANVESYVNHEVEQAKLESPSAQVAAAAVQTVVSLAKDAADAAVSLDKSADKIAEGAADVANAKSADDVIRGTGKVIEGTAEGFNQLAAPVAPLASGRKMAVEKTAEEATDEFRSVARAENRAAPAAEKSAMPKSDVAPAGPTEGVPNAPAKPGMNADDVKAGEMQPCLMSCFVAGTTVATADGPKAIEDLREGDRVLSRNDETGAVEFKPVVHTHIRWADSVLEITARKYTGEGFEAASYSAGTEETFRVTDEHPFWVEGRGWTHAGDLTTRDFLTDVQGKPLDIVSIRRVEGPVAVYNAEIKDLHTYFVTKLGVWSHNCATKGPPNPHGSRGGPAHQQKVNERIEELKAEGHEHIAGGSKTEEVVRTPGGKKSSRRPDITTRSPDGSKYRENVGLNTKGGIPKSRERDALDDLEGALKRRPGFTPYEK